MGKSKWGSFATENWGKEQKVNRSLREEARQSCEEGGARRAAGVQRAPREREGRAGGEAPRCAGRPAYAPEAAIAAGCNSHSRLTPGSLHTWGLVHGAGARGVPGRPAGGDAGSAQDYPRL